MEPTLAAAAALAVSGAIGWLYLRQQTRRAFEQGKMSMAPERAVLTERLAGRDAEVERLQKIVFDLETAETAASARLRTEGEKRAAAEQLAGRVEC